jgi:HlyD family secretion protein
MWLAVVLLLAAGGGFGWWWSGRRPAPVAWQGYADADFVKIGPTQQGLLTAVFVGRGEAVAAGTPLFTQDDTPDRAASDQIAQQLAQAEDQVRNLEQGSKPTEIAEAAANVADARATFTRAKTDLARSEALLSTGAVAKQTVDQQRAEALSAQAKVDAMQAALAQARAPMGRDREIAGQRAAVAAERAALETAEWRVAQRHVAAPAAGRVADVLARPGETMAAGQPVVSLLPPGNIFVRFFIPEAALSSVRLGETVALACDGCPGGLSANISFISPQAEYTPPLIYSESSKSKLVFLLEARPPLEQATRLNPGEPIEVRPMGARTS